MAAGGKTDLAELLAAHRGIISDRITERKVENRNGVFVNGSC